MKNASITLPTGEWGQVKSKYPSDSFNVSASDFTSGTINIDTMPKGSLQKQPGGTNYNATPLTAAAKDQFEAIFADGTHHLLAVEGGRLSYSPGDTTFTQVTSGYSATSNFEFAMALDRVYFGNGSTNQVYDKTTSYGGVTYTAPKTKVMGCQVPSSAPTAALVVDSTSNRVPAGAHTYKITYLYYGFEESNPSSASGVVTADASHTSVNLTSIPIGGYGVTARKVYRDNNDSNYVLLGTIADNTTTTYTDTSASGGAVIPSDNSIPPVFGLVVPFLDRLFLAKVSGSPYNIYYTNAGFPDISSSTNFFPCNAGDPIQAIVVYLGRIIVLNRNSIGQVLGNTSDTFRYVNIQTGIGCTDNRSVQIRTINGVPTLVWLSDKGLYQYNGSSVTYISEPIEDLVNLNIQQSLSANGSNSQTTQADFQGGTASGGIDLTATPGTITTPNPKRLWDDETDWEGGSSLTNCATHDGSNTLKTPIAFTYDLASGALATAQLSGSTVVLPTVGSQTVPQPNSDANYLDIGGSSIPSGATTGAAQQVTFQHSGTVSSITLYLTNGGVTHNYRFRIYADLAGAPNFGSVLASQTGTVVGTGVTGIGTGEFGVVFTTNLSVTANVPFWVAIEQLSSNTNWDFPVRVTSVINPTQMTTVRRLVNGTAYTMAQSESTFGHFTGSSSLGTSVGSLVIELPMTISFSQTAISSSGTWLSAWHDTGSDSISTSIVVTHTGSYPTSCSGTTTLEGSNDQVTNITTEGTSNQNGAHTFTLSGKRYWRVRFSLSTTDNQRTPSYGIPTIKFNTTATWISEVVDCTADVTAYDLLETVQTTPSGTSVTYTVATSSDNVTYSSYSDISLATVYRYIKVKAVLVANTNDVTSPTVTSIKLKYTIVANLVSSAINTAVTPAGWDVFQASAAENSGTIAYYMRTASSSGALSGASFAAVTIGNFPTNTPLQYVQWKVVLTSTPDHVPTIDSVTINWFIGTTNSIRVASLFYNRNYYLAAAEYSQTTNNLVLELDGKGNWRVLRGLAIGTLGLFFNKPYYCSAASGQFVQWLTGLTNSGTPIAWDVRTKAFDFATQYSPDFSEATKIVRKVSLTLMNTGATIFPYYSVDNGTTWLSLCDQASNGATSFTLGTDDSRVVKTLYPNFADGNVVGGRTVMLRLYSNDAFSVEVHKLQLDVSVRPGQARN